MAAWPAPAMTPQTKKNRAKTSAPRRLVPNNRETGAPKARIATLFISTWAQLA
jgi:hypothetical protein